MPHQTSSARQACQRFSTSDEGHPLKRTQLLAPYIVELGHCFIEQGFNFATGLQLRIADHVYINHNVWIDDTHGVDIGEGAFIGPNCQVLTQIDQQQGAIVIEPKVWLGANVKVYPGVTVGESAIVGAGAVVTRDVEAHTTIVGRY